MLLPETRSAIKNSAPRRKEFFIDFPSAQLTPVILRRSRGQDRNWKAGGRSPIQYTYRHMGGLHPIFCARIKMAPGNSEAHLTGKNAVDRGVGDGVQTLQRFIRILGHTGGISQEQDEKNEGVRRQLLHPLQHLIERQIVEPNEVHAACKRREFLSKGLGPI